MELLRSLYEIHSPSGAEDEITEFIIKWVGEHVPEASVELDEDNLNLYITKGQSDTYPCLVAHTDQVQAEYPDDYKVFKVGDHLLTGYSTEHKRFCGLGADDKNGIWVALRCLELEPVLKVALFSAEEVGCQGSSQARMEFFDDCRFVLQADRRGASDFITCIGNTQLCTEEFAQAAGIEQYGYHEENGMMTDVLTLADMGLKVSCANMSCGYYEPHTDREYTVIPDLMNCLDLVLHIIHTCTEVYPSPQPVDYGMIGFESTESMEATIRHYLWIYPSLTLDEVVEYLGYEGFQIGRKTYKKVEKIYNKIINEKKGSKNNWTFLF